MFYRIVTSLNFATEDEGKDFYHDAEVALPKSETIILIVGHEIKGTIYLQKCFHDEDPTKPCELIKHAETP